MAELFDGKVVLVTGGSSGIGKATAIKFAQEGAQVVIADISDGGQTVEEIGQINGEALFIETDVTHASAVEALVQKTVAAYGRLDCAFNNAGIGGSGLVHEISEEQWDRTIDLNLKGVWLCMKYQLPQMIAQGGGAIVNNSSAAGLAGFARNPVYSASKHGVIGLSKSAALQYAKQGIRINAVCPGAIVTPMLERAFASGPGVKEQFESNQPTGHLGNPEQVAETVVWLCSEAASRITGVALPVDGGILSGFL